MKIARATVNGTVRNVVIDGDQVRLAPSVHADCPFEVLKSATSGAMSSWHEANLDSLDLIAPVAGAPKIIAVGLNYADHTSETGFTQPEKPLTFAKYSTSITGPYSTIEVPSTVTSQVDYEAELTLVIGRKCGGKTPATMEDVAFYTVANDVSARDVQFGDVQWTRGKSFDTFTPLGPFLVTPDEFGQPGGHAIYTEVNGDRLQDDTTSNLIFDVPTLLEFVSKGVTLEPGDLILTGTPSGAGAFMNPPRYLADGDTVVCGVDGIGELRNQVTFI